MLRLVDVVSRTTTGITFRTAEIVDAGVVPYVVYDTSTGVSISAFDDYYGWRALTVKTSTGSTTTDFTINNSNLYPSYTDPIPDYTLLSPKLLCVMSLNEYQILHNVITRFDLVRKRLPNPGIGVSSTNDIGQNGTVSFAGGHEKKMTVLEIMQMMTGTIIELNGTPPRTTFFPLFQSAEADIATNPYTKNMGFPLDMSELVVMGTLIRCLIATGLMEVDMSFSVSDSGLQLTFDRVSHVKGWHDALLTEYKEQKTLFKWNHANHRGVGIGTSPWSAMGIWGTLMNSASYGGQLSLQTVLGINSRGNVPM